MSAQAIYSSQTFSASTLYDGAISTASIVVVSTNGLSGGWLNIDKYKVNYTLNYFSSMTALSICNAINSNNYIKKITTATIADASSVVLMTSKMLGAGGAWTISSSSPTALVAEVSSGTALISNGNIDYVNDKITIANHGYGIGLPVLFVNISGTTPGGLVNRTTYYITPIDVNNYYISAKSSDCYSVPISKINITTASVGGGVFTLTPITFAGQSGGIWYYSNDGSTWVNMNVTTVTCLGTAGTTVWDFSYTNFIWYRYAYTAATWGATKLKVILNGKNIWGKSW
jgi:hypothetical protein